MNAPVMMTRQVPAWQVHAVLTKAAELLEQAAGASFDSLTDSDAWAKMPLDAAAAEQSFSAREVRSLVTALCGTSSSSAPAEADRGDDGRGLYERAIDVIRQDDGASPGTLARALGTDEAQATALLDQLEQAGIVGPAAHCGYREVRAA